MTTMTTQIANIDSDGFLHLQWRNKPEDKKEIKTKPKKKKKEIKFKKGSWKDRLYKMIKKFRKPKNVDKFHNKTLQNIILHKTKYKKYNILINTKKNDTILINIDNNIYMSLTNTSYEKLGKIRRIAFEYKLESMEDFDNEYSDIYVDNIVCHDINSMCSNILYFRQLVDGIAELQALTCGFTRFQFKVKVLVYKDNGNIETYKNINKFIKEYELGKLL